MEGCGPKVAVRVNLSALVQQGLKIREGTETFRCVHEILVDLLLLLSGE